jgi:hemolysin activation/secretion protein
VAGALIALPVAAPAQPVFTPPPPPLPGIIERVLPAEPGALGPAILPPEPGRITGPGEAQRVPLARVAVEGNTALDAATLLVAAQPLAGHSATLAEIETARLAALRAYRAAGFPYVAVAARLAPAGSGQAELRLVVTEGEIVAVTLEGAIGPAERQARRFLEPLIGRKPLPNDALERALLLASDIPGVAARGVLRPMPGGAGALELVVQLSRAPASALFNLDNRGYDLTGAWQGLVVGQLNSFTGLGERTELALLHTDGNGQNFLQVTEEFFLGWSGLRLRAYAGIGRVTPGAPLAAIGYTGETRTAGVALGYPVIRSRPLNLNATAQLDAFESTVEARLTPEAARTRQARDAVRAVRIGLDGALLDDLLPFAPFAATTTGLVRASQGIQALGASGGDGGLAARLGSDFGFTKVVAEISRLQPLWVPAEGWLLSLLAVAAGQWSDDVLPPAERFYLGGNRLGRGFYAGQVTGDRALAGTLELQLGRAWALAIPAGWPGGSELTLGTQFYLFRDGGRGKDNGPIGLDRTLESWGGGVRLQFDERVQLDLEAVRRLTRQPDGAGTPVLSADAVFARLLLRF